MYDKFSKQNEKFLNSWYHRIFLIILYIVSFIVIKYYVLPPFLTEYDDSVYKGLEQELTSIAETHDFDALHEFNLQYNSKSKEMKVTMYDNTSSASVTLTIDDYETSYESYTLKRNVPNKAASDKLHLIFIIIVSFIPTLLIDLILMIILSFVLGIAWIYDKCHDRNNKTEEKLE